MTFACHLYALIFYLFVCQLYVLVCHLHVTCMYSYVIRVSLVCTRMSTVCHSMDSYVIRMSLVCGFTMNLLQSMPIFFKVLSFLIGLSMITPRNLIELTLFSSILFKIKVDNFYGFYLYPANCEKLDILLYFHLWKVFLL